MRINERSGVARFLWLALGLAVACLAISADDVSRASTEGPSSLYAATETVSPPLATETSTPLPTALATGSTDESLTPTPPPEGPTPAPAASGEVPKEVCLACHGPYEKLMQTGAVYTSQDGEEVNPHTTIDPGPVRVSPHTSGKGVAECYVCHKPHTVPLASVDVVARADVKICYSCHHTRTFSPCSNCHGKE